MEIKKTKFIMGTEIEIIINSSLQEEKILKDIEKSFDIFSDLEKEFSRFNENSSLSKLNKLKFSEVSDKFLEVLNLAIEINRKTNGFFNPLVNISNIGYSKSFEKISPYSVFIKKREVGQNLDLKKIKIIGNKIILEKYQNIDFGGIVKGYTVDLVKIYLEKSGYNDFIVNAGGDMFVSKKSIIAIDSPDNSGDMFALLDLEDISLSTSGTYKRKWKIDGENYHHILNPEINQNNSEILSISLLTKKCYIGDSYATACIAMGIKKSLDLLQKVKIDGVIIGNDNKIYKIGDLGKYNFEII